jgi:hypothetical protein
MMMFDRVPTVIFDIIHAYLSHYDYRQLLNCNQSIFGAVKYDTVYYEFKSFDHLPSVLKRRSLIRKVNYLTEKVRNQVKCLNTQISMSWFCHDEKEFTAFCSLFVGIHKLSLSFPDGCWTILSLELLSTISYLSLDGIANISLEGLAGQMIHRIEDVDPGSPFTAPPSKRGIYSLNLKDCDWMKDISEITRICTLRKVSISFCRSISDISCLSNIEELYLDVPFGLTGKVCSLGGEKQKSLVFANRGFTYMNLELQH